MRRAALDTGQSLTGRSQYMARVIRGGILRDPAPLLCLPGCRCSTVAAPPLSAPHGTVTPASPTKVARNLIRLLFQIARKRCNSNDAISHV